MGSSPVSLARCLWPELVKRRNVRQRKQSSLSWKAVLDNCRVALEGRERAMARPYRLRVGSTGEVEGREGPGLKDGGGATRPKRESTVRLRAGPTGRPSRG